MSVDFWRGFALLTIFINHVPGHVLGNFTFRNFGWSDAAELFVLLAGVSAAFAYGRAFEVGRRAHVSLRIWLRAFQLYAAHLALLLIAFAVIGGFVVLSGDARVLEWYHLDLIQQQPIEALVGLAMMTYQPAYLNILPLYVVILVMAPMLVALMRINIGLGLAVSAAIYLATHLTGFVLPVWPNSGDWFFNPFAWQVLFACGLAIGRTMDAGGPPFRSRVLDVVAPLYLALGAAWALGGMPAPPDLSPLPRFLWELDKTNLDLPRLLHVLALLYCVSRLALEVPLRESRLAAPLILIGRHALPVFCFGTVLSLAAQVLRPAVDGGIMLDIVIAVVGFFLQWLLAWALDWHRSGIKATSRRVVAAS